MIASEIFVDPERIESGQPATHVIVIGIGFYSHLPGGDGPVVEENAGLGQLSSPPSSAKAFADWMLESYHNPEKPLASLTMLVAGPETAHYENAQLEGPVPLKQPTMANTSEEIYQWLGRCDTNEDNMAMFFYCGHGVSSGLDSLTLLLKDYGENPYLPMDGAIDFSAFHRGMAQCKASEQCFFIDACRSVDGIAVNTQVKGKPIIQDNSNRKYASVWKHATFYSTLAGERAYGRKNKPSYYTEALIKGLNGMGSHNRNPDGLWRVSTGNLNVAINTWMSYYGSEKVRTPYTSLSEFDLHIIQGIPDALVLVTCNDNFSKEDTSKAHFKCLSFGQTVKEREPGLEVWEAQLPPGMYDFSANLDGKSGEAKGQFVIPPCKGIDVKVDS